MIRTCSLLILLFVSLRQRNDLTEIKRKNKYIVTIPSTSQQQSYQRKCFVIGTE